MRKGIVFYKCHLAGIITETNEGEYVFSMMKKNYSLKATEWITHLFLSTKMVNAYKETIEKRFSQLGL